MELDADAKGASGANSRAVSSFTARFIGRSPPPVQDHLVQLLPHGFHVRIGKACVQRAHAIGVRTRAADGVIELSLADVSGRALGAVAPVAAIVAAWDAEGEADIAAVEVRLHGGLLTWIKRGHAVHHGLGKGWALGTVVAGRSLSAIIALLALVAVVPTRDVKGEAHVRSIEAHIHGGGSARLHGVHRIHHRLCKGWTCGADKSFLSLRDVEAEMQRATAHAHIHVRRAALRQRVHAVHLRGGHGHDVVDEHKERLELVADHLGFQRRVR